MKSGCMICGIRLQAPLHRGADPGYHRQDAWPLTTGDNGTYAHLADDPVRAASEAVAGTSHPRWRAAPIERSWPSQSHAERGANLDGVGGQPPRLPWFRFWPGSGFLQLTAKIGANSNPSQRIHNQTSPLGIDREERSPGRYGCDWQDGARDQTRKTP
jgi:hypothetical protein